MLAIMRVQFVLLLLLTSLSQASIPASTINADAAAINRLNDVLKSSTPNAFRRSQSLVCEMINKCCAFIKPRLADYVDDTMTSGNALVSACIGNYPRQSVFETCPTLTKFVEIAGDEDFLKYVGVLSTVMHEVQSHNIRIPQVCSSDEIYVILCDWTQRHQMESCERKRLAYVAQHANGDDYRTFVQNTKKNVYILVNAVKKAFPEINVIETTTSNSTVGVKTNLLSQSSSIMQITNASAGSAQTTKWIIITSLIPLLSVFFCRN
jgi:hypothetical protein